MGTMLHPDDPERLGGYWLNSRLGAGGQGVVYEAYDRTGARVAVKALHHDAQQLVRDRFGKEVDAARAVAPFCTARIIDAALTADTPYIVSEYIPGPTLAAAVREQGVFAAEAVTRLAAGIATALAAIHQAKVVHRDLKPGNVLLGPDGPRVIDFGIARASDMSLTTTGAVMGTLGYMAPEVLRGQRATPAADIFGWGALVLYAASGEEPFRGENIGQVAHRTAAVDPDLGALPAPLRPLVAAALAKDPALRPTATELLLGIVGETPAAADPRRALLEAGARRAADPRPEARVPGLGERAELAYAALSFGARQAAHELLLRLVVPGEDPDGSQDTVRTASYEELYGGRSDAERAEGHAAITALAAAGALIVAEDHSIRPVSAALIRAWTRLRAWTEADRGALALRHRLGHAAREWQRHGRRPEDLQQGTALRAALDWSAAAAPHVRPNPLELDFLAAGRVSATRTARRRRQLLGGLGVLLVVALVAGGLAYQQSRAAAREQARAAARTTAQAANSLRAADPRLAMLLGVAAWDIAETEDSRAALLGAALQGESDMLRLSAGATNDESTYRRMSGNGSVLVVGEADEFQIWDVPGKRMLVSSKGKAGPPDFDVTAVSDDGRLLLGSGRDGTQVLETATLKPVGPPLKLAPGYDARAVTGNGLVLAEEHHGIGAVADPLEFRRQVVRASDGKRLVEGAVDQSVALSPDGRLAATCQAGGAVSLWHVGGRGLETAPLAVPPGTEQPSCSGNGDGLAFSPDGTRLTAGDEEHYFWTTADGAFQGHMRFTADDPVFSSEGRFMLGFNRETGAIEVHPAATSHGPYFTYQARQVDNLPGDDRIVMALDEKAGRLVFHRIETATVEFVALPSPPTGTAESLRGESRSAVVSSDGRTAVLRRFAERQQLVDLRTGRPLGAPVPQRDTTSTDEVNRSSLARDGGRLAFADRNSLVVWDVRARKELFRTDPEGYWIEPVKISADGRHVAAVVGLEQTEGNNSFISHPGTLQVWDVASGKRLHHIETVRSPFALSPDGAVLVTAAGDVVDLVTGKRRRGVFKDGKVQALAFAPDGRTLAVAKDTGLTELWDGRAERSTGVLSNPTLGKGGSRYGQGMTNLAFSPDGRFLAGLAGGTGVQFWDLGSRLALGAPLDLVRRAHGLAFDGSVLRILDTQDPLRSLDTDPGRLVEAVCRRAGREVTEDEWRTYVPAGIGYRKVCS